MKAGSIQTKTLQFFFAVALLSFSALSHALIVCSLSSPGYAAGYVPANLTTSITSTTFSVTCSRDNQGGPPNATVQYEVSVNNGMNALGSQNRASLGTGFLNYILTTDSSCTIQWSGAIGIPTPTATFTIAKNTVITNLHTFYGCIPPGQLALPPEGVYTDAITMIFTPSKATGASSFIGGTIPVSIVAPASCNFTTTPANIVFSYTSFNPVAVMANSTFGMRCSNSLAYSIALDSTTGVIAGLSYSLTLNTVGSGGSSPLASIGNGVPQSFFVNGTIAAGQAGACASATCSGTQTRTLTITY